MKRTLALALATFLGLGLLSYWPRVWRRTPLAASPAGAAATAPIHPGILNQCSKTEPMEYRAWAAQCHAMAAKAKSDEDKRPWLELAEKWQRLAVQVANSPSSQQAHRPSARKIQTETLTDSVRKILCTEWGYLCPTPSADAG